MTTRRLPWAVVDSATPGGVRLAAALTRHWGPGLCYLWGVPWKPDRSAVLPGTAIQRILDGAASVWWWSEGDALDLERVTSAVARGCVPVQAMPPEAAARVQGRLAPEWYSLVMSFDPLHPPARPPDGELTARAAWARDLLKGL